MTLIAGVFFTFLYRDTRALNQIEDSIDRAVAQLPPNQRVVNGLTDSDRRVNRFVHMVDRACIGVCFSYGNYEPTTKQFRVQVARVNAINVFETWASSQVETGSYMVKTTDLPLFQIYSDGNQIRPRPLEAGHLSGVGLIRLGDEESGQ